jgi:hypothetical protein
VVGRPEGGKALSARELFIPGDSVEARRKVIERALKIDGIAAEAKAAARKAGLDDNQSALLEIANQKTPAAQLKKVREFKDRYTKPRRKRSARTKQNTILQSTPVGENVTGPAHVHAVSGRSEGAAVESPPIAPTEDINSLDIPPIRRPTDGEKEFETLKTRWQTYLAAEWNNTPVVIRQRFVTEVLGYTPRTPLEGPTGLI